MSDQDEDEIDIDWGDKGNGIPSAEDVKEQRERIKEFSDEVLKEALIAGLPHDWLEQELSYEDLPEEDVQEHMEEKHGIEKYYREYTPPDSDD